MIKSEDLSKRYTSAGEIHLRGEEGGRIHDASCGLHIYSWEKEEEKDRTRGHEKLSLGKTASYSRTHSLIRLSSSRNEYRF